MENKNKVKSFFASKAGRITITLLFLVLIWGFIFLLVELEAEYGAIALAVICGFFGWRALNRITPNIFLFMSWVGWLFYFTIKGSLAFLIGLFVAPFQISKWIANAIGNALEE